MVKQQPLAECELFPSPLDGFDSIMDNDFMIQKEEDGDQDFQQHSTDKLGASPAKDTVTQENPTSDMLFIPPKLSTTVTVPGADISIRLIAKLSRLNTHAHLPEPQGPHASGGQRAHPRCPWKSATVGHFAFRLASSIGHHLTCFKHRSGPHPGHIAGRCEQVDG